MSMKKMILRAVVAIGAAGALTLAASGVAAAEDVSPSAKLSHSQAVAQLSNAGITVSSSGGCSDRYTPTCTSLEQVNSATIQGIITLKSASGCAVNVTGGTEIGHADGTYSHWNGYKLDTSLSTCLNNYIQGSFTSIGGNKWQSASGNIYYKEGNHWDITYYNCGGC